MEIFDAIILGIVEGLTEFLPISSTGHMILTSKFLDLKQDDILKCFEVVIQLGSILAVVFMFFDRLKKDFILWQKLIVSFVPTAVIGYFCYSIIKTFFNPNIVAYALIVGGFVFIIVEFFLKSKKDFSKIKTLENITFKQAFIIGLSQCFAMIPGTSRSGSTIIAGLLCKLDREMAAKFSFLLSLSLIHI